MSTKKQGYVVYGTYPDRLTPSEWRITPAPNAIPSSPSSFVLFAFHSAVTTADQAEKSVPTKYAGHCIVHLHARGDAPLRVRGHHHQHIDAPTGPDDAEFTVNVSHALRDHVAALELEESLKQLQIAVAREKATKATKAITNPSSIVEMLTEDKLSTTINIKKVCLSGFEGEARAVKEGITRFAGVPTVFQVIDSQLHVRIYPVSADPRSADSVKSVIEHHHTATKSTSPTTVHILLLEPDETTRQQPQLVAQVIDAIQKLNIPEVQFLKPETDLKHIEAVVLAVLARIQAHEIYDYTVANKPADKDKTVTALLTKISTLVGPGGLDVKTEQLVTDRIPKRQ